MGDIVLRLFNEGEVPEAAAAPGHMPASTAAAGEQAAVVRTLNSGSEPKPFKHEIATPLAMYLKLI